MPNRGVHVAGGLGAGVLALHLAPPQTSLTDLERLIRGLGASVGGMVGGVMPDVLDPPRSPNHRSLAHGVPAAILLAKANWRQWHDSLLAKAARMRGCAEAEADPLKRLGYQIMWALYVFLAGLLIGFAGGYASHLLLDGLTPNSLPLIG